MAITNESDKYLGDAEELFKQGKKKEALEKMLDSARASGTDLNHLSGEYGLSKSKVPLGGSEKTSSKSYGLVWGLGIFCAIFGAIAGGVPELFLGGIIGAIIGYIVNEIKK